jgi:hypothetical protein
MKFAKLVYWTAGIWGLLVIAPLYFMLDAIGRKDPPPVTHPGIYYGFVGVALAWQMRPMMIPSMVEKFTYAPMIVILVMQGRTNPRDLTFAATDTLLGILFVAAYVVTGKRKA